MVRDRCGWVAGGRMVGRRRGLRAQGAGPMQKGGGPAQKRGPLGRGLGLLSGRRLRGLRQARALKIFSGQIFQGHLPPGAHRAHHRHPGTRFPRRIPFPVAAASRKISGEFF